MEDDEYIITWPNIDNTMTDTNSIKSIFIINPPILLQPNTIY